MQELRHKVAQMLIMGFDGSSLSEANTLKSWLQYAPLGGVLLFDYDLKLKKAGKNLIHRPQIKTLLKDIQAFNQANNPDAPPLFTAIDYEGGAVDRLKNIEGSVATLSARQQAALATPDFEDYIASMANTLHTLGFNLNFAPVVDLNLLENEGIIGQLQRSFSSDALVVAAKAQSFIEGFAKAHIATCYKHFPGHGSASGDTHTGFVDVSQTFNQDELQPYLTLSQNDCCPVMVMTAHVINRVLDPEGLPATLSKKILTELLRKKMHYQGVIVSDDLQMQAISKHFSLDKALELSINAGSDMLIIANQLDNIGAIEVIDKVVHLVNTGIIPVSRINEANQRINKLKTTLKLETTMQDLLTIQG